MSRKDETKGEDMESDIIKIRIEVVEKRRKAKYFRENARLKSISRRNLFLFIRYK